MKKPESNKFMQRSSEDQLTIESDQSVWQLRIVHEGIDKKQVVDRIINKIQELLEYLNSRSESEKSSS